MYHWACDKHPAVKLIYLIGACTRMPANRPHLTRHFKLTITSLPNPLVPRRPSECSIRNRHLSENINEPHAVQCYVNTRTASWHDHCTQRMFTCYTSRREGNNVRKQLPKQVVATNVLLMRMYCCKPEKEDQQRNHAQCNTCNHRLQITWSNMSREHRQSLVQECNEK